MEVKNNTILITGGGSGIGLAFAKAFIELGNTVIICGRNEQKLKQVKERHHDIHIIRCDINDDNNITSLVDQIREEYPNLNFLINNAAVQYNFSFLDNQEHWQEIHDEININLTAQIKLIDAFLPLLKKQSNAAIANVTSALARIPWKDAPIYCATKAGFEMFTRVLRYQLESSNIRVFEIIPPPVDTEMCKGEVKGKISPKQLVQESILAMKRNQYEIQVGKTKIFFLLNRLCPYIAERIIGRI